MPHNNELNLSNFYKIWKKVYFLSGIRSCDPDVLVE